MTAWKVRCIARTFTMTMTLTQFDAFFTISSAAMSSVGGQTHNHEKHVGGG